MDNLATKFTEEVSSFDIHPCPNIWEISGYQDAWRRFRQWGIGWKAWGGGDLKARLEALRQKGILNISDNELELFRLVSSKESGGFVNVINSWDTAYMSMGFIQFTLRYHELQKLIKRAPESFRKHGIELEQLKMYVINRKEKCIAIKGAPAIGDMRKLEWAEKFFKAGLEDEVVISQIEQGREILQNLRKRFDADNFLNRFDNASPNLWAFIYETHNSRPAILHIALARAIDKGNVSNVTDPVAWGRILISELNNATYNYFNSPNRKYKNDEAKAETIKAELAKVQRIIISTGVVN